MSDDLLIKINGDAEDFKKALTNAMVQATSLNEVLSKVAEVSNEAFHKLTETVGEALKEFMEADTASRQLNNALQNQGIFTTELRDSYKKYADQISLTTGIQGDQIVKAQAVAQSFLGQIPITQELTKSIVDLSVAKGVSLTQAAEEVSKAIGNGTGSLLREGLQLQTNSTETQRYAQVLDFLKVRYGDAAESINPLALAQNKLNTALKDGQQELGERFAPAVTAAVEALTSFIQPSKESGSAMVDFKVVAIAAGLAISALGVGLPLVAQGFLALRAAAFALNLELTATKVALAGLGIGLVIIALSELVLHWEAVSSRTKLIVKGMIEFISGAFGGVGKVISSALHADLDGIKSGLREIQDAFKEGVAKASEEIPKETEKGLQKQDDLKKKYRDKIAKSEADENDRKIQLDRAQNELILLELKNASDAQIELKKKEIETLNMMDMKRTQEQRALLKERLEQIRADEIAQQEQDKERNAEFEKEEKAAREEHGNAKVQMTTEADKKEIAAIKKDTDTKETAQKKVYTEDLKNRQKAHNLFLQEEIKYGTAYAAIHQAMNSAEVQGVKSATGDLVALTQSKNSTLKEIGKIASIANITIKTAESAMNIYAGFSTIPIIGPALGIAGAAAAIAFGAEQIQNVAGAQSGALVQGAGYGDKIPFMLEPGELVAPRQNFEEVVQGVAQQRGWTGTDSPGGGSANVAVTIGFSGPEASRVLTAQQIQDRSLGTYRGAR